MNRNLLNTIMVQCEDYGATVCDIILRLRFRKFFFSSVKKDSDIASFLDV